MRAWGGAVWRKVWRGGGGCGVVVVVVVMVEVKTCYRNEEWLCGVSLSLFFHPFHVRVCRQNVSSLIPPMCTYAPHRNTHMSVRTGCVGMYSHVRNASLVYGSVYVVSGYTYMYVLSVCVCVCVWRTR